MRDHLAGMWREKPAAYWMMTDFYTRDVQRPPGDNKMPSMPRAVLGPSL